MFFILLNSVGSVRNLENHQFLWPLVMCICKLYVCMYLYIHSYVADAYHLRVSCTKEFAKMKAPLQSRLRVVSKTSKLEYTASVTKKVLVSPTHNCRPMHQQFKEQAVARCNGLRFSNTWRQQVDAIREIALISRAEIEEEEVRSAGRCRKLSRECWNKYQKKSPLDTR